MPSKLSSPPSIALAYPPSGAPKEPYLTRENTTAESMPRSHSYSSSDSRPRSPRSTSLSSSRWSMSSPSQSMESTIGVAYPRPEQSQQRSAQPPNGGQLQKPLGQPQERAQQWPYGQPHRQPQKLQREPTVQGKPRPHGADRTRAWTMAPGQGKQMQNRSSFTTNFDSAQSVKKPHSARRSANASRVGSSSNRGAQSNWSTIRPSTQAPRRAYRNFSTLLALLRLKQNKSGIYPAFSLANDSNASWPGSASTMGGYVHNPRADGALFGGGGGGFTGLATLQGLRELPTLPVPARTSTKNMTHPTTLVATLLATRAHTMKRPSRTKSVAAAREAYAFVHALDCQSIANKYCQADCACRQTTQGSDPYDQLVAHIGAGSPTKSRYGILTSLRTIQHSRIPSNAPMWVCLTAGGRRVSTCNREPYLRNLTTSCRSAADLNMLKRLSVRTLLQLPVEGARSCAVVGSSGSLLYERFGDEIDAHDVVIRYNTAPLDGFQPVAGSKTTVRVVATTAALAVLQTCGISRLNATSLGKKCTIASNSTAQQRLGPNGCCGAVRYVVGSSYPSITDCIQSACLAIPYSFEKNSPVTAHLRSGFSKRAGSGPIGLALADLACGGDSIELYGFGTTDSLRLTSLYHYYEKCRRDDQRDVTSEEAALRLDNLTQNFPRFKVREAVAGKHELFNQTAMPEVEMCEDGKVNICGRVDCFDRKYS